MMIIAVEEMTLFAENNGTLWREDPSVRLIGIEAACEGVASGRCADEISEECCNDLRVVLEEFLITMKKHLDR